MECTDDDIQLWHHTRLAKNELKHLSEGYEEEDKELSSDSLREKYKGSILEETAKTFRKLPIEDQKELLYTGITGEETGVAKKTREAPFVRAVVVSVRHYTTALKRIKKYDDWVKRSCDYKTFLSLSLKEKKKFHNIMVNFHDQCVREIKEKGQLDVPDQVLDSSPTDQSTGCPPNFEDTDKWEKRDPT